MRQACLQNEQSRLHSSYRADPAADKPANPAANRNRNFLEIYMSTASATVTASVKQDGASFVCTLNGKEIGRSKHSDYFVYHARRADVKAIREAGITHFAYVDANDIVTKTEAVKPEVDASADPTAAIAGVVAAATNPAGAPVSPAEPKADAAAEPAAATA